MARNQRMLFRKTSIDGLTLTPSESGLTPVLAVTADINRDIAVLLRCGFLFKENGDPTEGWTTHGVDGKLADIDIVMPHGNATQVVRPKWAYKFVVRRENDVHCTVSFRMHFDSSKAFDLLEMAALVNKGVMELCLRSLQMDFDFSGADGGTRSTPGGSDGDESEDENQPALMSATEMGGTHQKRQKRTRQPQVEETTVEEIENAVSVQ